MLVDLAILAACAVLGVRLQRGPHGELVRARLWTLNYVGLIPLAAVYAFLSIRLDRELVAVVACGVVAWWIVVALAGAYAHLVTRSRRAAAGLWLVGAFPNTGFVGYPLAHLAYGQEGLRLAVVYDQVSLVVPMVVVATVIAASHAPGAGDAPGAGRALLVRQVVMSPPLWTVAVLLALRLTLVPEPLELTTFGAAIGHVVGPVGFLLLGLSLPLHEFAHDRHEVATTIGAVLVRVAAAPAVLWLVARLAGIDVPAALYLLAAMPTAFMTLVVSRIHPIDSAAIRLGVLMSSAVVIPGTALAVATGVMPGSG